MSMGQTHSRHPVREAVRAISEALDKVVHVDPGFMSTGDKAAVLTELSVFSDKLSALAMRVLANADDVALDDGARSAAAWLAHRTRTDVGPNLAAARLGEALELTRHRVRDGLAAGAVNVAQARIIVRALEELPDDLDPDLVEQAEAYLVDQAAHFDPKRLRVLGLKVLEVIAPEVAERHEREALERAERHARRHTSLALRRRGDGTTDIRIRVADVVAGRFTTYLDAFTSPRTTDGPRGGVVDPATGARLPRERLLGEAFCSLLEAVPATAMPLHGGSATTLVVTVDLEALRSGLGTAVTGEGTTITASEARRLACQAGMIPAVLGGHSQPLDLGRRRRLFSSAQRVALALQHPTCRGEGCSVPAAWSEAHHAREPWSRGGRTDLADAKLLCPWHHRRAHDPAYTVEHLPNGDVRFHRRP